MFCVKIAIYFKIFVIFKIFCRFSCPDFTVYVSRSDLFFLTCPVKYFYTKNQTDAIIPKKTNEKFYIVPHTEAYQLKFDNCDTTGKLWLFKHESTFYEMLTLIFLAVRYILCIALLITWWRETKKQGKYIERDKK